MFATLGLQIFNTLLFVSVGLGLTIGFVCLYVRITPYNEFQMIRAGNMAAAYSLVGALIGFVLVIGSVVIHSPNITGMFIWAVIGLLIQLIVYLLVELLLKQVREQIENSNTAAGIFLGGASLAAGIVTAACLVP